MDTTELSLESLEVAKLEALVDLMFLAAYADGEVQDEERAAFRAQLSAATAGRLGPPLVDAVVAQLERRFAGGDRDARLARIRGALPDARMRRAAFVLANRVVLADGKLGVDEEAFLKRAAEVLEVDPSTDV